MPSTNQTNTRAAPYDREALAGSGAQRIYEGGSLLQIAMPMGGIGAGSISLNGYGGLQDYSIANKPDVTALPDSHETGKTAFALLHIMSATPITKLVEGPLPVEKVYDQGVQSQGYRKGGHEGMPRFEQCSFTAEYPFGAVSLTDPSIPLAVEITGWSPLIPLDDVNSGIPASMIEYTLTNTSKTVVEFELSYHLSHFAVGETGWKGSRSAPLPGRDGVNFTNTENKHAPTYGSVALSVVGHRPKIKAAWFRGGWFDGISALWRQVSEGGFSENDGNGGREYDSILGGSVLVPGRLIPGESVTIPFVISWYFPNVDYSVGAVATSCASGECAPGECAPIRLEPRWKPFYTTQWADADEVAAHVARHYADLRRKTAAFAHALFSTTAPDYVLDAVSANLAIMKSPTVLRQANGNMWAWEGCFPTAGCCHGSCTHVWNYAQAFPHLFPQLERTLREQELMRSIDDSGYVNFRSALPDGPPGRNEFTADRAASDGQLGGIMKLYRDWQICGDDAWLASLYPLARRSLDYCIGLWDPDELGVLIEPHHNTYDIEFWGADGMCSSIYLGALAAMASMCKHFGDSEAAARYRTLAEQGAAYFDHHLYNGEFYEQKVEWERTRDRSFVESIADGDDGDEMLALLRAEGPKYQYGSGCLADGVIGHWMATLYGIDTPQTRANVIENLRAIFAHNFSPDLFDHICLQRPGYALGHEAGLILCSWPNGGKPTLPFVYSDEVWTGIEYQVASHMIAQGLVDEGLTVVKAARSRYDGRARNPFNEFECGSFYARAMASYALLPALSGFRYSAVTRTLHFGPQLAARPFQTFFGAASGYGTIKLTDATLTVSMVSGHLAIDTLQFTVVGATRTIHVGARATAGADLVVGV